MPVALQQQSTAAVTVNNCPKIYAIGGHNGAYSTTNEAYNPRHQHLGQPKRPYAHSQEGPVAAAAGRSIKYMPSEDGMDQQYYQPMKNTTPPPTPGQPKLLCQQQDRY